MEKEKPTSVTTDSRTLDEFMKSLQRLFKIAIYYPAGHTILDQATSRFMELLTVIAGDDLNVTIEIIDNELVMEGIKFDPRLPFVDEFKTMLTTLDIASLTIDREISVSEVHAFVRKILFYKARSASAKQFVQIEVSELPHSTKVVQKEYLVRNTGLDSAKTSDDPNDNLNTFIESLNKYGLNSEQIANCRALLESLPQKLPDGSVELSDLPHASWDDVALLLARSVKDREGVIGEGKRKLSTHANINALAAILKKLESSTNDKKSRQTINLLISIIKNPQEKKENRSEYVSQAPSRVFSETPELTVEELQQYSDNHGYTDSILNTIPEAPSSNETLSILMQLAAYDQPMQTQIRMQQLFRELLTGGSIGDKTWEILSNGLKNIVEGGSTPKIQTIINQLLDPLRKTRGSTLHLFFQTVRQCHPDERRTLWPYVVNELLVTGSRDNTQTYHKLCQFAASLPLETMQKYLPQLQNLESFQDRNIAGDIFYAVTPPCYPLFGFLLKTDLKLYIGERVISGIKKNSKDQIVRAMVPLLDMVNEEHVLFLHAYLYQHLKKDGEQTIRTIVSQLITTSLTLLPQERRDEAWIPTTIEALGTAISAESRTLLEKISSGKKLLFIPEWPTPCRKAAEQALKGSGRR
ncbi:hypothetical protein [Desulfopila sp. IMCC35008]|uniref:hypothetical protein n=1 Tax=Desulfopila sp. IMCC35008 TaxID=2653858 RepID=UPI0013D7FF32|nr:hypothetical protein [Desulfopila sp. IMCC35008]